MHVMASAQATALNPKDISGFGSSKIRQQIADEGAVAVIPSKRNAKRPIPHDPNLSMPPATLSSASSAE